MARVHQLPRTMRLMVILWILHKYFLEETQSTLELAIRPSMLSTPAFIKQLRMGNPEDVSHAVLRTVLGQLTVCL
jgi:hypothetical protein